MWLESGVGDGDAVVVDRSGFWRDFLKSRYQKQMRKLATNPKDELSLIISYSDLVSAGALGVELSELLISDPYTVINEVESLIRSERLIPFKKGVNKTVDVRFTGLLRRTAITDIKLDKEKTFVSIECIVRKRTQTNLRGTRIAYTCANGHLTYVTQDNSHRQSKPVRCSADGCRDRNFVEKENLTQKKNHQQIQIEELPEGTLGAQPQPINVTLYDDLTNTVEAGDRIILNGIVRSAKKDDSPIRAFYIEGNSIEISQKEYSEVEITAEDEDQIKALAADPYIYEKIAQSIAPSIFGMQDVKRAIAIQLFGGDPIENIDHTTARGDIHVLLIGDPSCGKSHILEYVKQIAPRVVYTSGKGATAAGLTASAVKDEFGGGGWTIEAGAMVIADKGICIIDELGHLEKKDRSAMHDALESQQVNISKAGITASFRTRCSLLAAANPIHGRFDEYLPISDQIGIEGPLLSRFDLIFILLDNPDEVRDSAIANHIVQGRGKKKDDIGKFTPEISPELFRKFIAYAKRNCRPQLSSAARDRLETHYVEMRKKANRGSGKPMPITTRQLEGLIRITEAVARVRLASNAGVDHAEIAIAMMESCLKDIAFDQEKGVFDVDALMTGKKKSVRDLDIALDKLLKELAAGKTAKIDDIIAGMTAMHFDEYIVRERLSGRIRLGDMYCPKEGLIRVV